MRGESLPASKQGESSNFGGLEYRAIIFNAARDGKLGRLQIFLEFQKREFIEMCLNIRDGTTDKVALVIACRNGHMDVAKFLINRGADPSLCGTVSFDGETIHGAPPLWAAAAAGHLDVVKYLVEEAHVDINQTTLSSSSPLRGACYDGHLDIVQYLVEHGADVELANRHGHTPLMIAAFRKKVHVVQYLLVKGASPLRASYKGNTALHDAAESDCLPICTLLVDAGAPLVEDESGLCPLMGAAIMANLAVFPLLEQHTQSSLRVKDAHRLLGCTLVDKKMDLEGAMREWRCALAIQLTEEEQEIEVERSHAGLDHPIFDAFPEATTLAQLDEIYDNPDKIRMQALVVRERILGGAHTDVHYFLRMRGAVYCDLGDVNRCYDLWIYAVELQQIHLGPLHVSTLATLQAFQETFSISLNEVIIEAAGRPIGEDSLPVTFDQISVVFTKVCIEMERLHDWGEAPLHEDCSVDGHIHDVSEEKTKLAHIALQLLLLTNRLRMAETSVGRKESKERSLDVLRLIHASSKLRINLLHIACIETTPDVASMDDHHFPSIYCIEWLLKCGMNPLRKDENGNTPLHIVVSNRAIKTSIVKLLLDAGASLWVRNEDDDTPYDIMRRSYLDGFITIKFGRYINLQAMAALAVRRERIEVEGRIPRDMLNFVLHH